MALLAAPLAGQSPSACEGGKTALVLSGGGVKGLAHIPLLSLLDSIGAVPDLIVGTSIGSLIGAMYASGYSGAQIDSIAAVIAPAGAFASGEARPPRPWRPFTPLLVWEKGERGLSLVSPVVNESQVNTLLSALLLRGNLLARGSFDSLPIPFRAVAVDLANRDTVVIGDGDLARAVRASISVPLILPPVAFDTLLLVDGGLVANIPIEVARQLGATRVIVSDVTAPLLSARALTGPTDVANQLAGFLMQQQPDSLSLEDLYIKVDVEGIADLDDSADMVDSLRARGMRAADSVLRTATCLPRNPRRIVAQPRQTGTLEVSGGIPGDARVLERILGIRPGEALQETELHDQLTNFAAYDTYRSVWLGPRGGDTVSFRVTVQRAASRIAGVTLAYDNDLGGRLGFMYLDRHLFGTAFEGSGTLGLSRLRTDLTAGVRRYFGVGRARLAPAITGRINDQKIVRYNNDGQEIGRPTTREAILFVGLEREWGPKWLLSAGFDGRVWRDADTTLAGATGEDGHSGGALLRAAHYPGSTALLAEAIWSGTFRRLQGELSTRITAGRFTFVPRASVGWGEFLPLQQQFPLGGSDGFPGLAVEEIRGDREVFGGLQTAFAVHPPFSIRLLLAAGRIANGGPLFWSQDWLAGARVGIGLDTPIGPVQFEYGVASNGRDQLFVRIGRWF